MTNKTTKRALLTSVMALFLCFTMLLGTTFAWFTDSVTSAGNKIIAGTLDVGLYMWTDASTSVEITNESAPIFGANSLVAQNNAADTLWEPGKTQVVYLSIKNNGNLALKYQVALEVKNVTENLTDVVKYAITPDAKYGEVNGWDGNGTSVVSGLNATQAQNVVLEKGDEHFFALSVHMDEEAGNDYMNGSIEFDIKVLATQLDHEDDSFGPDYDKEATFPVNAGATAQVDPTADETVVILKDNTSGEEIATVEVPKGALAEDATEVTVTIKESETPTGITIGSNESAKTLEIDVAGLKDGNTVPVEVSVFYEKGLIDVKLYHNDTLIPCTYDATTGYVTFSSTSFSPFTVVSATKVFEEGAGTEENPYIIKTPEDLLNISKYYHEYKYYKVADGVETLDLNGIGNLALYGSFDGNGVKIINLTTSLFQEVGKPNDEQKIKISNMDVTVHTTNGRAFVRNIYNAGETIFENVSLHGYIEGQYNMGSFYNYGTANHGDSEGSDYTVSFVNAKSDVTLVCTTGNAIGGMLGHGYEGADYKLYINMDENSAYTGKMYTTGTATCYQVMAMCSHGTYFLNGAETSRYENEYDSTKLTVVKPTKNDDGYYVTPAEDVDHYIVYVNAQLTAYDENGNKIANKAGMTGNLGNTMVSENLSAKIFDLITSAKIVNGLDHDYSYAMDNGALTVYTGRSANYASGWITLQVNQYDAEGTLLATGIDTVYTFAEPVVVSTADELIAALADGAKEIYAAGVVVEGTTKLNTGATIIGATFKNENGIAVDQTIKGTFKNCTFEGKEALRWCYTTEGDTVVFENCVIKTNFRGVHFDAMNGDVIFRNCEINGFNAIGGAGTVTFEKCTFGNDASSYNGLNMYSNIKLVDCTFNFVNGKTNFIDMEGEGKTLEISNCKAFLDGVETDINNFIGGSKIDKNTVVVK